MTTDRFATGVASPGTRNRPEEAVPLADPRPLADLRLLAAAVAAWAALALTIGWAMTARALVLALIVLLGSTALALHRRRERRRRRRRRGRHGRTSALPVLATFFVALTGLLQAASIGHDLRQGIGPLDDLTTQRATVTLVGRVVTEPRTVSGRFGTDTVLVDLAVREVSGRGRQHPAYAKVRVRGDAALTAVRWWSTVQVTGRLSPPREAGPALAVLTTRGPPVELTVPNVVARGAEVLRQGLRDSVSRLPDDARGLLPGLVIGDTSAIPAELDEAMRTTGMTHLTAVSGSNVAVVVGLTFAGCALVGIRRGWRPWLAMLMLAGFVVLARPDPSVVRAAVMGSIGLIGLSRHRTSVGMPALGAAIIVILTIDPWLARSYGFVLSTLATLGLLLLAGPWGEAITRRVHATGSPVRQRISLIGPAIAVPLAAQVVCAPVIVLLQGSVSVVAVLANLLAAPLVPVATVGGVAAAGISLVSPTPAGWVAWLAGMPTLGIARIARVLATVPGATIPWPDGGTGALLLAAVTVVVILVGRTVLVLALAHPVLTSAGCVLLVALLTPTTALTWPAPDWRVVVCDVGQGDGLVLRSGPDRAVVVDVGPDPGLIDGCLDRLGVRSLDAVIVTHFHADHVDGIHGVTRGRRVGEVLLPAVEEPPAQARAVHRWAAAHGLTPRVVAAGEVLTWGELTAHVWGPVRRIDAGSIPNNASVVLAVETGGARALLLGDIEREAARQLLGRIRREADLMVESRSFDLVKTPHHGSSNLDEDFLEAVRAPVAVISVGEDNDYGHPTRAHLDLLRRLGFATYRTDLRGDIALVRGPEGISVTSRRPGPSS